MRNRDIKNLEITHGNLKNSKAIYTLEVMLFRGGSKTRRTRFNYIARQGLLGEARSSRLPLVLKLHEAFISSLASGGSSANFMCTYEALRYWYRWADSKDLDLTPENSESSFLNWVDFLIGRVRTGEITEKTAYNLAHRVAHIVSKSLNLGTSLKRRIRISAPRVNVSISNSHQNLEKTLEFCLFLMAISQALTLDAIRGELPIEIKLENGKCFNYPALRDFNDLKAGQPESSVGYRNSILKRRLPLHQATPTTARPHLINLKIETELLIFISQTGMNLAQAFKLKHRDIKYTSNHGGDGSMRVYKPRRGGYVNYKIYQAYISHLKQYLTWKKQSKLKNNELLFPFQHMPGRPAIKRERSSWTIRRLSAEHEISFISPQQLRKTRLNWIMRRTGDLGLTSEFGQHTAEIFMRHYNEPCYQIALIEISNYYKAVEPCSSIAPGQCISSQAPPELLPFQHKVPPEPDCKNPAGCLFCKYHRTIESKDFIWSIMSFKYCKQLELDGYITLSKTDQNNPIELVIIRLDEIITNFRLLGEDKADWTREAEEKIIEGKYHPAYEGFIAIQEMT